MCRLTAKTNSISYKSSIVGDGKKIEYSKVEADSFVNEAAHHLLRSIRLLASASIGKQGREPMLKLISNCFNDCHVFRCQCLEKLDVDVNIRAVVYC